MNAAFTPKTVRLVFYIRDEESCTRCGQGLRWEDRGHGWSMHHRRPRGMGGSKDPALALPSNALTLCGSGVTGCHGWVETNRDEALEQGFLVSRYGTPEDIPVLYRGELRFLTSWGSTVRVDEVHHAP